MPASRHRITLLGPPASGKGTQGRRLAKALGLDYLSTGALLRQNVARQTPLGIKAEPILARGAYLPDDLMEPILEEWLVTHQSGGWVLDGFPRSLPQAKWLDGWLVARDTPLDAAIRLEVPFSELLTRVIERVECPACRWSGNIHDLAPDHACPRCGETVTRRSDDTEENLTRRHREYTTITGPVIDWYRSHGILHTIDATAPTDEVATKILHDVSQGIS